MAMETTRRCKGTKMKTDPQVRAWRLWRRNLLMTAPLMIIMQCTLVHGWWAGPHMVIAKFAYGELHETAMQHVDHYINAFNGFYPGESEFFTASIWADSLSSVGIHAFEGWHFIDQPLLSSDLSNTTKAPAPAKENIVWALDHCYKTLQFGNGDIWGRALMLRFLIHLVGDIHQPLHCVNRYSKVNIDSGGDHHGEDVKLNNPHIPSVLDLHALWDAAGGFLDDMETADDVVMGQGLAHISADHITEVADHLRLIHPLATFPMITKDFAEWAAESLQHAVEDVYRGDFSKKLQGDLDDEYINSAKTLSGKLMALAGYRLAFLLNNLFPAPPDKSKYVIPNSVDVVRYINNCTGGGMAGGVSASAGSQSSSSPGLDKRFVTYIVAGLGFAVVVGIVAMAVFRGDKDSPKHKYKTLEMAAREGRYTLRNPRPVFDDGEMEDDDSS